MQKLGNSLRGALAGFTANSAPIKLIFLRLTLCFVLILAALALKQGFAADSHRISLYAILVIIAIIAWQMAQILPVVFASIFSRRKTAPAKKTKRFFLRTVLSYVVVAVAFFFVRGAMGSISGIPFYIIVGILMLTACLMVFALVMTWKVDSVMDLPAEKASKELSLILHDTKHLGHVVYVCQIVAAVAIMVGVALALRMPVTSTLDSVQTVFHAVADGIWGTITGVLCSLILENVRHFIKHKIEAWFIVHDLET